MQAAFLARSKQPALNGRAANRGAEGVGMAAQRHENRPISAALNAGCFLSLLFQHFAETQERQAQQQQS
ncbi:hypothetical protein [Kingella denitrificans]|uniref:hypothetical protein n=1 Tax=Kingella denitrificans TaxID=502 RepID=UPI0028D0A709|nr:hypothetical protein [Kingella denitrificans]